MLDVIKPGPQQRTRILDACAIDAIHKQTDYPVISRLYRSDAPQFKLLTKEQGLCWIQSVRHYKKLKPVVPQFREKLEEFRGQYWNYYAKLLSSPEKSNP